MAMAGHCGCNAFRKMSVHLQLCKDLLNSHQLQPDTHEANVKVLIYHIVPFNKTTPFNARKVPYRIE